MTSMHSSSSSILVLHDGSCGLCHRSVKALAALDWMKRLRFVDYRDEALRQSLVPDLRFEDLDLAMHIRLPDGRTYRGFFAFRAIAWHMPPLWIIAPFLYLPGMKFAGDKIYANIATRRKQCTHEHCSL